MKEMSGELGVWEDCFREVMELPAQGLSSSVPTALALV